MPRLKMKIACSLPLQAKVADVWAFVDDREAQVKYHPRIDRIDVVSGEWGAPGSRMVVSARQIDGTPVVAEQEMVSVDRPHGYATQTPFPDGVSRSHIEFGVDGDTVVSFAETVVVTTRPLNWLEYAVLTVKKRAMRADAEAEFMESYGVLQRYLYEECGDDVDHVDDEAPAP